jgi:hypothetical protein
MGRQDLLTRKVPAAPQIDFVLNEATLRRWPDRPLMAGQLRHILEMAALPNVSVRVLSFDGGLHLGMTCGYFVVLDFPGNGREPEPSVVYSESLTGALYLDKPQEVQAYEPVWADINAASLNEAQSRKLIQAVAKECASS